MLNNLSEIMKKFLILSFVLVTAFGIPVFAEEVEKKETQVQFPYVSLGLGPAPIPLPIFGIGYKAQWNHHGVNAAVNAAAFYYVNGIKGSFLYDYYFKPNVDSEFYFGIGPVVGIGFSEDFIYAIGFASEFAFGKQYRNELGNLRFFEVTIDFPFGVSDGRRVEFFPVPVVIFNYGVGF